MFPHITESSQKARLRAKISEWRYNNVTLMYQNVYIYFIIIYHDFFTGSQCQVDLLSGTTQTVTTSVDKWLESQRSSPATPQLPSTSELSLRFVSIEIKIQCNP